MKYQNLPWTPESAAYAAKMYQEDHTPEDIGVMMCRSTRSVIAKLTQMGLYRAAPKPTREPTKAELVGELCHRLGMDPQKVYTLTAASHEALVTLLQATAG